MKKYFGLILFFVVLLSYGQLVRMHVWQDDNALFFKLAHIPENTGYLSAGPFGIGAYKYIQTPYIPVYNLFKYNTVPYFILAIVSYFLATLTVYKVASKILGEKPGRISGLLYAAGYIASDGFIRLFNTLSTSVSIVFISFLTYSYWKFYKEKNIKWYLLSVFFYWLSIEFSPARTHYLIGVVLAFEIIFLAFKKPILKSVLSSLARIIPFIYLFYRYYLVHADSRSANVTKFIVEILKGSYYQLYSLISSIGNVFVSDRILHLVTKWPEKFVWILSIGSIFVLTFFIFKNIKERKIVLPILFVLLGVWVFASRSIFINPVLNLSWQHLVVAFLGGSFALLMVFTIFLLKNDDRKLYFLFLIWFFLNIAAYSAYNPSVSYETINRYLAHSLFALVFIVGIVYKNISENKGNLSKLGTYAIYGWIGLNLISSVVYQNQVVKTRSVPVKNFYSQLKTYVPEVNKGDVFYFDISDSMRSYFNDSFSVASMPETTAIAWRYGVDRYDLKLFTDFNQFSEAISKDKTLPEQIHSFWYGKKGLEDTSSVMRDYIKKSLKPFNISFSQNVTSSLSLESGGGKTFWDNSDLVIDLGEGFQSSVPVNISINAKTSYPDLGVENFPFISKKSASTLVDLKFSQMSLAYVNAKRELKSISKVSASSSWRDRPVENVNDSDTTTVWQPDRIKFRDKNEWVQIELPTSRKVSKFVWINNFGNNTPTKYKIEVSVDKVNWTAVKSAEAFRRIDSIQPNVETFDPVDARFIRMTILGSLNDDAPGISEVWVIPAGFEGLDLGAAENFLTKPFAFVESNEAYQSLKSLLGATGNVHVHWQDSEGMWKTTEKAVISLIYDGVSRKYDLTIPPSDLKITKIKLTEFNSPTVVSVNGVGASY